MTDTDWSFSLRSSGFFDSDDDNEENVGNAGNYSHPPSSSSKTLQQIDLAAREDSALYKPNPWSIARINAASRPRQPNATLTSTSEKPAVKKLPRGAIVDAFKRQAQKPIATAQANRRQNPSQKPAPTPVIDAPDNSVSVPARSTAPIAHITTSAFDSVPTPSQPRIPQQRQGTIPPPLLPRKASPTSHPSPSTRRSQNPYFSPSLKRVQPLSSPVPPPHPPHHIPNVFRPQPTPPPVPAYFGPHILEPTSNAHVVTDCVVAPTLPADQGDSRLARHSRSKQRHTVTKLERGTVSPHLRQRIQHTQPSPYPRINQPFIKASPTSEMISSSPSLDQARRFFEYPAPPETPGERPGPEPLKEAHSTPSPPRPRTSPPKKRIDAYDQLPPSPDSEWSTLKPQTRAANDKSRSKVSDLKSGRFRLPLSLGNTMPKEPPQKKARVITYLPPPPPKKQKPVAQPRPGTPDICTGITIPSGVLFVSHSYLPSPAFQTPRRRSGGLLSPPPSDETGPPSSPTPAVKFDSNGVLTRYGLVRGKIRQVRMPNKHLAPSLCRLTYFCDPPPLSMLVAEGARCSTLGHPRARKLWCRVPRSGGHARQRGYTERRDCIRYLGTAWGRCQINVQNLFHSQPEAISKFS